MLLLSNKLILLLWPLLILECKVHAGSEGNDQDDATMLSRLTTGYVPDGSEIVKHQTTLGIIQGQKEASVGHGSVLPHYYAFRGIPYAHSPVDDLRFADPVDAVETWPDKYLDATHFGNVCLQYDQVSKKVVGEEDCLFLNVFTPVIPKEASNERGELPVLVFIHGGGYLRGSSSVLSGGRLAGQNIIVVTMNYRLGALGFFSTGDTTIPGNFGLLDQLSAIRWVKQNIAQFGGDPNLITIGGFSAGAASVHTHMLSPLAKGLFNGVIMVSGCAFAPWSIQKDVHQNAKQFAEKIQCPLSPSAELKSCLIKKTTEEIVNTQVSLMRYEIWPVPFSPVVDAGFRTKPYLAAPMRELSPTSPMPVLISVVPHEGILFSLNTILLSKEPTNPAAAYNQLVRDTISGLWFQQEYGELAGEVAESFYYTDEAKHSIDSLFEQLAEIFGDFLVNAWVWEAAGKLADDGNPVHAYMMTQRDPETPVWATPLYDMAKRSLKIESPLFNEGISHGDDLALVFSKTAFERSMDETNAQLLVTNWVNFMKKGSPLIPEKIWPAVSPGGPILYYNVSANPHMSQSPFRQKETNFWLKTLPYLERKMSAKEQESGQSLKPWIMGAIVTYFILSFTNRRN